MSAAAFITTAIMFTSIGFVFGAVWRSLHRKPEPSARPGYITLHGDEYSSRRVGPRCNPRVRV